MKKSLALLLSGMMVLSLVACGGSETEDTGADTDVQVETEVSTSVEEVVETEVQVEQEVETEAVAETYYVAVGDFKELVPYEVPDLSGTTWSFAGGTVDGVELTEGEFLEMLEAYSGKNNIVFDADGATVTMEQGAGVANGYCEYMEDGAGVGVAFDINGSEVRYYCMLSEVEGVSLLLVIPDEASAFYYLLQ